VDVLVILRSVQVGRPGSQGYETLDANTYAEWGVDYVKEVGGAGVRWLPAALLAWRSCLPDPHTAAHRIACMPTG
jgi:hypothetical protein